MRTGEGTRSTGRELCDGKRASAALERKRKRRGRQTLSVRGKNLGRRRAGPITTEAAARLHSRYHYSVVTGGPRQAVTSACPHRPLLARGRGA
jgi:hypothetical protein